MKVPADRSDLALLLLALLGATLSVGLLLGAAATAVASVVEGDSLAMASAAWLLAGALTMLAASLPALHLGVRRIAGRPEGLQPTRPGMRWLVLLLLYPFGLAAGMAVRDRWTALGPLLLALGHIASAGLPVLLIALMARQLGPPLPSRRAWGQFLTGLWAVPPLALALEMLLLLGFALLAATLLLLAGPPEDLIEQALALLESQATPLPVQEWLRLIPPAVLVPLGALGLGFVSVAVPLVEEALKSAALWPFLRRRLTVGEAWLGGVLCGAGYALFEALLLAQPGPEYMVVIIARAGATWMHAFSAGLTAWGIGRLLRGRGWLPLALGYGGAVVMHGLWNLAGVALGLASAPSQVPGLAFLPPRILQAAEVASSGLLVLLSLTALVGVAVLAARFGSEAEAEEETAGGTPLA